MRILTTSLLAAGVMMATAQNSNVVNAYNYMSDGELAKAVEYIEPAAANPSTSVKEKTWRYRGDIYRLIALGTDPELKDQFPDAMKLAIGSYLKAIELDTKESYKTENVKALGALQGASLNAGNEAFGKKEFDKAIMLYGNSEMIAEKFGQVDSNAVFNKALAYESKGDLESAMASYRKCISIGYDKPEIYRYLATLQKRTDDMDGAIETTRQGRVKYPEDKDLILDEMAFLLNAGQFEEAEKIVGLAIQKDPNNAVLHSVEGSLYDQKANPKEGESPSESEMIGWYEKAEASYMKSLAIDPEFFDANFNLGVLYNNRAAYEYEKCNAIKQDSEYMKCKKVADEIYLKAVPYFEKAHALQPDDVQTIQQLLKLYAKTNDQVKYKEMKDKLGQ